MTKWRDYFCRPQILTAIYIGLSFLLTSTAWLAWEYHLLEQTTSDISDLTTMGAGYFLQAVGMFLYAFLQRKQEGASVRLLPLALILHTLCMIPGILSPGFIGTLLAGLAMNLLCGYIMADYLHVLARAVPMEKRGLTLGAGYSLSILVSWLLSTLDLGKIHYSNRVWIICLALTAAILMLLQKSTSLLWKSPSRAAAAETEAKAPSAAAQPAERKHDAGFCSLLIRLAGVLLLFSIVNSCGSRFSSSDFPLGIHVETSRLFYAAGLLVAGLVSDRDRRAGAVTALSALVIPFAILALRREPVSLTVLWALSYFVFGFYAVFRMLVFVDLAAWKGLFFLAGCGLMIGRVGDALGETLSVLLSSSPVSLIFITALLFVGSVFLFFQIYHPLYMPETPKQLSEQERFFQFSVQHDLSSREREVLRLLLKEKTNGEIAQELNISENTVKFHVRNLLQKTGAKNRNELISDYHYHFEKK